MIDEGGRQKVIPTDKLRHGARSPKPYLELTPFPTPNNGKNLHGIREGLIRWGLGRRDSLEIDDMWRIPANIDVRA